MLPLKGIHHVTAITSSSIKIYDFFTNIMGLRLVKKTVNQDDIQTYHLFFADEFGSPGTDITFFDFKGIQKKIDGTNQLSNTGFRVKDDLSIEYWVKRFNHYKVKQEPIRTMFNRKVLFFYDFDEQAYAIYSDEDLKATETGHPWEKGPVPVEFAITGLGPIGLTVSDLKKIDHVLANILFMTRTGVELPYSLYEMGEGGNGSSIIVKHMPNIENGQQGYGGIHHIAFRVQDKKALDQWTAYLNELGAPNSGYIDRFYFKSLYTRLHPGILFEFATDGPGFIDEDENLETLGEKLALPPKLKNQRTYIENTISPIDTKRSDRVFEKEYF